jgi:hypothetical protein
LAKLVDQKSLATEREINDRLRELWGLQPGSIYNSPVGANEDSEMILGVSLSLLGFGTRDDFYAACRGDEIRNGSLNRLVVLEEIGWPAEQEPSTEPFPSELTFNLQRLLNLSARKLEWNSGARELYEDFRQSTRRLRDETQHELWIRGPEQMVRMATNFASCRFDKVISLSDMELAHRIVKLSGVTFQNGIDDATQFKEMGHQELVREIERRIATKFGGEATEYQIGRTFRHNKKHKLAVKDALEDMVNSGTFEKVKLDTDGRPKAVYRLRKE